MSGHGPPANPNCLNCGAPLAAHYCSACGQAADVHVPTSRELLHEVLEGVTHSDSRLWRTLTTLWFRPGELTLEFIRGRRMAYLPPFRLYLVVSVIFFLVASSTDSGFRFIDTEDVQAGRIDPSTARPPRATDCDQIHPFGSPDSALNQRFRHGCMAALEDTGRSWEHHALSLLPKAMFVFVPLIALLHMLLYWRPRHRYVEHLLFFLHVHAFYFSTGLLVSLLTQLKAYAALAPVVSVLTSLLGLGLLLYTALALKRVFAQGWMLTLFKGAVLFLLYSTLLAVTFAAVFFFSAMQL